MRAHGLSFDDIAEVMLSVGQVNLDRCRPVALGSVPANHIDLAGNMHFAVAAAILHGGIPLSLYHETRLADEVVLRAMPRVKWRYDASLDGHTFEPARVEIATKGGQRFMAECSVALGHPDHPMTLEQRIGKFIHCAASAATPVPKDKALRIVDAVTRLDECADIESLMGLLA
jgi:2-methylcitrate dehydratase PrpD